MNKSGQSLLEATFGLVIIVFIVIALVDLGIVLYAVSLNDSVCRTAASAAAAGRVEDASQRAQLAIEQTTTTGYGFLISQIELVPPVEVKITSQPVARPDPETGQLFNPGGSVTGTVTVRTKVEIRPFAMDFVFRRCKPLMFSSAQTFPVRYVIPAN